MKKYLSILMLAFALIGCNDYDSYSEANYNANDIIGEWLLVESENKSYVMDLVLNTNSMMKKYVYKNPSNSYKLVKAEEGTWTYSRATHNLETNVYSDGGKIEKTLFYTVNNVDAHSLQMFDKHLHSSDTYIRVVGTYELFIQNKQNIECLPEGFHAQAYESINENIATVDNNGTITGTSIGMTFILAKDEDKKVAIKVYVGNGVSRYANEINTNISSVFNKYGNNYLHRDDLNSGLDIAIYTNPVSAPYSSEVQYHFDPYSGSIVCIDVIYNSSIALQNDKYYLNANYNKLVLPSNIYYVEKDISYFFDSSYYIMELNNGLRYGSTGFLKTYNYMNAFGETDFDLFYQ